MTSKRRISFFSLFEQDTPLAWSQLSHQKVRLLVAMMGISFANILIFMQLGFRAVMFNGVTRVTENIEGDLFLVEKTSKFLGNTAFPRRQLYRVAGLDGIASTDAFYYRITTWKNPVTNELTDVTVIAYNPVRSLMTLPDVNQQITLTEQPDTVLFDQRSLPALGPIAGLLAENPVDGVRAEAGGRDVTVQGIFTLGSSLFKRGHIVTSDINYLRMFGSNSLDSVHAGVIRLEPGADPVAVTKQLESILPDEITVLTHEQLIKMENSYWASQPPGIIFNFGTIMGFIVGVVIVYQVLYSDVNDHLSEYATLKAIGYSERSLLILVFQEAIILGIFGFMPGFGCSIAMYGLLGNLTKIALTMRLDVATQVFILTVCMCLASAGIASRKLQSADPADVF